MTHGSLFSGIGGFDLASEWMGWENVFHCEKDEFCQRILKHYWNEAETFSDITITDFRPYRGRIDVLTGGFPCQPYSLAGKRLGKEDDRHLWPEMLRAIREIKPRWVVGENVYGFINWNGGLVFDEVQTELEAEGYSVQSYVLPAASVGAPHRRDRIWFIAYSSAANEDRRPRKNESKGEGKGIQERHEMEQPSESDLLRDIANTNERIREQPYERHSSGMGREWKQIQEHPFRDFPSQPPICGGDDGLPSELDGITFSKWRNESIKAYGNAIVPQVAHQIFKSIQRYDDGTTPF